MIADLVLAVPQVVNNQPTAAETAMFWILAPLALAGGIGMVLARNAVHSALSLVAAMFSLGIFYLIQQGPFIGLVQIIVYTGAIMILFLFVLMIVGRDASDSLIESLRGQRLAATLAGLAFAGLVGGVIAYALRGGSAKGLGASRGYTGNVQQLAALLFHDYVFAFEATSALLITAAVGAMVLAFPERRARPTQPELSRRRFRSGEYAGPLPGPGVLATANSVATPALLPDGRPLATSVDQVAEPIALEQELAHETTEERP